MAAHANSSHSCSETLDLSSLKSKGNPYILGLPDK